MECCGRRLGVGLTLFEVCDCVGPVASTSGPSLTCPAGSIAVTRVHSTLSLSILCLANTKFIYTITTCEIVYICSLLERLPLRHRCSMSIIRNSIIQRDEVDVSVSGLVAAQSHDDYMRYIQTPRDIRGISHRHDQRATITDYRVYNLRTSSYVAQNKFLLSCH
jgi:hypothetical protein